MYWRLVYNILFITSFLSILIKTERGNYEGMYFFGIMVVIGMVSGYISFKPKFLKKKPRESSKYKDSLDWFWNRKLGE